MAPIIINGNFLDPVAEDSAIKSAGLEHEDASKSDYILVQSSSPLLPQQLHKMADLGLISHGEVSHNTYLLRYGRADLSSIRLLPSFSWVNVYLKEFKVTPYLKPAATADDPQQSPMVVGASKSSTARVVEVTLHDNQNPHSNALKSTIADAARIEKTSIIPEHQKILISIEERYIEDVAAIDAVRTIQVPYPLNLRDQVCRRILQGYERAQSGVTAAEASSDLSSTPVYSLGLESIKQLGTSDRCNRHADTALPLIEPFTLLWVAASVAEGALAWLGSKAMSSLSGGSSSAVNLQEESITRLAQIFQLAFEGERLQQANDKLRSLQVNLLEYNNTPSTSLDRLQQATAESRDLLETLHGLEWIGVPSYLLAVSLRLAVLQERLEAFKDNGELLNIMRQADKSYQHVVDANNLGVAKLLLLYPGVINIVGNWGYIDYVLNQIIVVGSKEEAIEASERAKTAFYTKELYPILTAGNIVRGKWDQISAEARRRAVSQCGP